MRSNRVIANVLTIAGSDSGGGAGIQADLKTFSALGTYGASVITALTAQNTKVVTAIYDMPPDFVAAQLDAVFGDIRIDAVKIGMLSNPAVIKTVADRLRVHGINPVVLDPVMVAKSGDRLLRDDAIHALISELLPLARLITPNLPEAGVLLRGEPPRCLQSMTEAAAALRHLGPRAVLVKGGHLEGSVSLDVFDDGRNVQTFKAPRLNTRNTHGTGCTLSAAITAYLGRGFALPAAIAEAKGYLTGAISAADELDVGGGHGPVHHFHALWRQDEKAGGK